jgi:hypothetical protein
VPKCFHLLIPPLCYLAIWLVESSQTRIWRHYHPELVDFLNPGMLIKKGCYPVHQMLKLSKIDSTKYIMYDTNLPGHAFHIPEHAF